MSSSPHLCLTLCVPYPPSVWHLIKPTWHWGCSWDGDPAACLPLADSANQVLSSSLQCYSSFLTVEARKCLKLIRPSQKAKATLPVLRWAVLKILFSGCRAKSDLGWAGPPSLLLKLDWSHRGNLFEEEQLSPLHECAAIVSEAKCHWFIRKAELKRSVTSGPKNLESSFKACDKVETDWLQRGRN